MAEPTEISRKRVLVVGSGSETGSKLVAALSEQIASKRPIIFAFCESPEDMEQCIKERCNGVIRGDFQSPADIVRAFGKARPDTVVFVPAPTNPEQVLEERERSQSPARHPSAPLAALDSILSHGEYKNVAFFVVEPKEGQDPEQAVPGGEIITDDSPPPSPPPLKKRGKIHKLKKTLAGGMTMFAPGAHLSTKAGNVLVSSESSLKSATSPLGKWRNRTNKTATTMESKETCTSSLDAASTAAADNVAEPIAAPGSLRIKIGRKELVDFVVGAVMDSGSLSLLKGNILPTRDITVTAE